MKITHVLGGRCSSQSANGIDKMVYNVSVCQAALGHEVKVCGISEKPPLPIPGVHSLTVPPERFPLRCSQPLLTEVLNSVPDVIHLHFVLYPPQTMLGRELKRRRVPYVVTPHGGLSHNALRRNSTRKKLYVRLFEQSYLNGAVGIHAVCRAELEDMQQLGVEAPIFVVPNGVDTASRPNQVDSEFLVSRIPEAAGKRVFLFLGRLAVWQKGLDLLIEAVKLAEQDLPDTLFVLAGPDRNGDRSVLEKRVKEAGLERLVAFPGPFFGHEKFDLIAGADVFVHTSRWDVMPTGMLEAMASGKPCLATEATNMGDLLIEEKAGIVTTTDPDNIAAKLRYLAHAPAEELSAMGDRARHVVEERFDWKHPASRIVDHYFKATSIN